MRVESDVALPYAQRVLEDGRAMAKIIRATVDLDGGRFDATAAFDVIEPDWWVNSSAAPEQNPVADPKKESRWRSDFRLPLREWLATALAAPGDALVVEGWHINEQRKFAPATNWRAVQLPAEEGFEDYLVVLGPTDDEDPVHHAVNWCPPHWCLGALVGTTGAETHFPAHNAVLDVGTLATMLTDVRGLFMRLASYDGYLIWRRND